MPIRCPPSCDVLLSCVAQAQRCLGPQPLWLRQCVWGGCLLNTAIRMCSDSAVSTQLKVLLPFLILMSHLWGRGEQHRGTGPGRPPCCPSSRWCPCLGSLASVFPSEQWG